MKKNYTKLALFLMFDILLLKINAQTTPPENIDVNPILINQNYIKTDIIDFEAFTSNTMITNQYQNQGVIFSGHDGSGNPSTYEYAIGYGKILHSETWYNQIRLNFVDKTNPAINQYAQKIEFDNPNTSETDFISVKLYDNNNNLIRQFMSKSPEHVVINFATPSAAYMVLDDSANTAYIVDNFKFELGNLTNQNEIESINQKISVFPNPAKDILNINGLIGNPSFSIFNLDGKMILNHQIKENKIDISSIQNGIYLLRIETIEGVVSKPFVKQ